MTSFRLPNPEPAARGTALRGGPRIRRVVRWAVIAALGGALTLPSPTVAQEPPDAEARIASLRAAFQSNDANRLAGEFPRDSRVFVLLPRFDASGFYGPGPLRALLRRIVLDTRTLAVSPADTDGRRIAEDTWHLKVRWTYAERASGAERTEDLYLALRRDPADAWRIVEMRASK